VCEQVSHHPPVSAFHADCKDFIFHGSIHPKLKFWGKSVEIQPKGQVTIELPRWDMQQNNIWNCCDQELHLPFKYYLAVIAFTAVFSICYSPVGFNMFIFLNIVHVVSHLMHLPFLILEGKVGLWWQYVQPFYESWLTYSNFGYNWTAVMGALHQDPLTFLNASRL
jgi:hypothetical protein